MNTVRGCLRGQSPSHTSLPKVEHIVIHLLLATCSSFSRGYGWQSNEKGKKANLTNAQVPKAASSEQVDTVWITGVSGVPRDGWAGSAESLGLSNDFCRLCARTKQNETEIIRWKNAPLRQGNCQMLPVHDISGYHKIQIRTEVQQGQQQQVRGGKVKKKNWNTTKQKQYHRANALSWEVVTPWGLALRKGSQSTREAPRSKAERGRMVIWGFLQSQIFIKGSPKTLQIKKASLWNRLSKPQPEM